MKIGSNKDINNVNKKSLVIPRGPGKAESTALKLDQPIKDSLVVQYYQTDKSKTLAEKHIDEKLAITILIVGLG